MKLADLVSASHRVAATGSRTEKEATLAEALAGLDPAELPAGVALLGGGTRQRQTGVGWAALRDLPAPAPGPGTITVGEVDDAFERLARVHGEGSRTERATLLAGLFGKATGPEQEFLRAVLSEGVRQGASRAAVVGALARASGVGREGLRRALALAPDLGEVARIAFTEGDDGLAAVELRPGRPVEPMLAGSAPDLATALAKAGDATVEAKLDGVRVQVHRTEGEGGDVRVFTRTLDDVTSRVPEVVSAARALPGGALVLDGEAIALRPDGRPQPFQVTGARFGSRGTAAPADVPLSCFFFDLLHADGEDLLELPASERLAKLDALVPPGLRIARGTDGERVQAQALAAGHEGVMVKALDAPYTAGRRGTSWLKVKPRHTFDLVVLAAEWGHGRRTGWLSNLHLGARDATGFVMLGKTFKGLTDTMLAWQTERLLELEERRTRGTVWVRPELVVEIAFDGLQTSRRYPGGVALRFARVLRHRPDKRAEEADTLEAVRSAQHPGEPPA